MTRWYKLCTVTRNNATLCVTVRFRCVLLVQDFIGFLELLWFPNHQSVICLAKIFSIRFDPEWSGYFQSDIVSSRDRRTLVRIWQIKLRFIKSDLSLKWFFKLDWNRKSPEIHFFDRNRSKLIKIDHGQSKTTKWISFDQNWENP